jgi:SAM-dependent methyltransferase
VDRIREELGRRNLTQHKTPQKNWDHHLLLELLADSPKDSRILDLGSGGGLTLVLLNELGFTNVQGLDFIAPPIRFKNRVTRLLKPTVFQPCYHILKGDLQDTGLPSGEWDFITCISVLEHGVDPDKFLREASRLLAPGGRVLVTFDYWENFRAEDHPDMKIFDLPWNIFNREQVARMIESAADHGLTPLDGSEIPPCRDRVVHYAERDYTFMAVALRKSA